MENDKARNANKEALTMLNEDEMEFESKNLQCLVKEKALFISELGNLADNISPGVIRSLVALKDKSLV
ncbi:predicted protein, partial [Arabidopsis lyrata subsp. lyrata]